MSKRLPLKGEQGPYELCPCDSGKLAKFCCRTSRHWFKPPRDLVSAKPTGLSHPKCFAGALEDCSAHLSNEHCIPRAALEVAGNKTIYVKGISWLKGNERELGTSVLVAGISCERHNQLALPFDTAITRTFSSLRAFNSGSWAPTDSTVTLVSGPDLERGMMKMLQCLAAAGWTRGPLGVVRLRKGSPTLVEMIYSSRNMASLPGLYLLQLPLPARTEDSISFRLLFDADDERAIVGLSLLLLGSFEFILTLWPLATQNAGTLRYAEAYRRPRQVLLRQGGCEKSLLLSWPADYERDADDSPIIAERHSQDDAEA